MDLVRTRLAGEVVDTPFRKGRRLSVMARNTPVWQKTGARRKRRLDKMKNHTDAHKNACSKCGKKQDRNGRYCKSCHAEYMRMWRRGRINVSREAYERLQVLVQ